MEHGRQPLLKGILQLIVFVVSMLFLATILGYAVLQTNPTVFWLILKSYSALALCALVPLLPALGLLVFMLLLLYLFSPNMFLGRKLRNK